VAFAAAALFLWLSAGRSAHAASADQVQGTTVSVDKTISWGTAGSCTQAMATADFGTAAPGATKTVTGFKGCVTSNSAPWTVTALATSLAGPGSASIPLANEKLAVTASSNASHSTGDCDSTNAGSGCTLAAQRSVVTAGGLGTGSFDYGYSLSVPNGQQAGTYSNTVTFTAAN
jgi:hypothetical protein